jgi:hypothetical protein
METYLDESMADVQKELENLMADLEAKFQSDSTM